MSARSKPPTINDVARLAGVSRATASRALGGYGRISKETVIRVQQTAKEIGYRPNEVARAMRAGTTKTIGLVVISDFTNAFFDRATKAIIDAAKSHGYQTVVSHTDEDIENERQAVKTLVEKRVDGLIVVPSSDRDHSHLSKRELESTPVVLIDRKLPGLDLPSVTTGDQEGAREAVRFAFGRGHREMGFIIAVPGLNGIVAERPHIPISTVLERTSGFEKGVKETGARATMLFCDGSQEAVYGALVELLENQQRPTVLFTSNNDMLLAVMKVTGSLKLAIGSEISLISFDDSPWVAAMTPAITVISRPVDVLGRKAVEMLLGQIKGEKVAESEVLQTELIIRDSVATISQSE